VETTNPINGNDLEAVTENLILQTPSNSDDASEEAVAVTEDTQPEAVEIEAQDQDDDVSYDDTETYDEDVEVEEPAVQEEPTYFTVKVDGEERQVDLDELTRGYSGQKYIQKGMAENAETKKQLDQQAQQFAQQGQMLQQQSFAQSRSYLGSMQQIQTQMQPIRIANIYNTAANPLLTAPGTF